jgi:hypothetical protein
LAFCTHLHLDLASSVEANPSPDLLRTRMMS